MRARPPKPQHNGANATYIFLIILISTMRMAIRTAGMKSTTPSIRRPIRISAAPMVDIVPTLPEISPWDEEYANALGIVLEP